MGNTSLEKYIRIFKEIDRGKIHPIYLLVGSEKYLIEEFLQKLISRVVPEDTRSFNLTIAAGKDVSIDDFLTSVKSYPFLSDRKLCVLKDLEKFRGKWNQLISYCSNPVSSTVTVLTYSTVDEWGSKIRVSNNLSKLVAAISSVGKVIEFERLSEEDLIIWVKSKLKASGFRASDKVASLIVRTIGENLYELKNEIEKIAISFDEGEELHEEDVKLILGAKRVESVYNLLDRLKPGMDRRAVDSLLTILSSGLEHPSRLVYRSIRHFLTLLKIKAGVTGINSYRYRYLVRQANAFSEKDLLIWLENLRALDIIIKSSTFPVEELVISAFIHSMNGTLMRNIVDELVA